MKPAVVMYSHSSYRDLWSMFFGQVRQHAPDYPTVAIVDQSSGLPQDCTAVLYEDGIPYRERVCMALEKIKEDHEFIIFHHEDMVLYGEPCHGLIDLYLEFLERYEFDAVRLIKCGEIRDIPAQLPGLYHLPSDSEHLFSVQPTLWRTKSLLRLFSQASGDSVWEFERNAQEAFRALNLVAFYCHHNESKRGNSHWDSKVYPYVATAVVKGKWNFREYRAEIESLLHQYGIDPEKRGIFR